MALTTKENYDNEFIESFLEKLDFKGFKIKIYYKN